jgi:hypothetical protein
MLTTSCDVIKRAPKQSSKICVPVFDRQRAFPGAAPLRAAIAARLVGSFVLLPLVFAQGAATRRRVPRLPPARPPHHGLVPMAPPPYPWLALGRAAGGGRSPDATVAASGRGANFSVGAGPVRVRWIPSEPAGACNLGRGDRGAGAAVRCLIARHVALGSGGVWMDRILRYGRWRLRFARTVASTIDASPPAMRSSASTCGHEVHLAAHLAVG